MGDIIWFPVKPYRASEMDLKDKDRVYELFEGQAVPIPGYQATMGVPLQMAIETLSLDSVYAAVFAEKAMEYKTSVKGSDGQPDLLLKGYKLAAVIRFTEVIKEGVYKCD